MSFGGRGNYFNYTTSQPDPREMNHYLSQQGTTASYEDVLKTYLERYTPSNRDGSDSRRRREEEASSSSKRKLVRWRGNMVSEREAKALRHVFDHMKDHFGHNRADPDLEVKLCNLTNDGRSPTWHGDIDFVYNIGNDPYPLAYIGVEVCIDLTPKLVRDKKGRKIFKDYGKSWVYAYLPEITMHKLKSYIRAGTGWEISEVGLIEDPTSNLYTIEARMHDGKHQPKPSFWVVDNDDATSFADSSSFSRMGSVQSVQEDTEQQQIHRGIGFFSVSMVMDGASSRVVPTPGAVGVDNEADLIFTLTSFSTWGVTVSIAPIVYSEPTF